MPANQQKTRDWKDVHTATAAIAITSLVTLWNAFATHDRNRIKVINGSKINTLAEECSKFAFAPGLEAECYSVTKTRVS